MIQENLTGFPGYSIEGPEVTRNQNVTVYGGVVGVTDHNTSANNFSNETTGSGFAHVPKYQIPAMAIICIVLSVLILATIIGNVFVIAAVILERSLQGVSNYLILSLAVTDLLVAIFVMPLSLVNEISVFWYLGNAVCDFWISVDVLCCTASILHLVAIAVDRFWGVSDIDYIRRRCARQIMLMILVVWLVAFSISIPPLFGWKSKDNDPSKLGVCMISQDLGYTVFSTLGAFYCPMILMVILNCKIYVAARSRIRKKNFVGRNKPVTSTFTTTVDMKTIGRSSSCSDISQEGYTVYNGSIAISCALREESNMQLSEGENNYPMNGGEYLRLPTMPSKQIHTITNYNTRANGHLSGDESFGRNVSNGSDDPVNSPRHNNNGSTTKFTENNNHKNDLLRRKKKRRDADKKRKDKLEMKRERKAAKVLGIITGAFIACWLPFFILAVLAPFCGRYCNIPDVMFSITLWLGYFNSTLNPILYTIFNPSFRKAFHKIIYGRYRMKG